MGRLSGNIPPPRPFWPITPLSHGRMATDDSQTPQHTRTVELETPLTNLLHTATANGEDPQGTYTVPAIDGRPAYTVEITEIPADERQARREQHSYCLHCDWSVSTDEYPRDEVSTRMVQHAIETGHDIESLSQCESDKD
jgi:predicted small metal-binding protein